MRPQGKIGPCNGGCWYCFNVDDDLVFCCEFDTYVHKDCAKEAHEKNPDDNEAEIINREVNR